MPGDQVHLISIPVVQWSNISPMLLDMAEIDDPFKALKRQNELRLAERLEEVRTFVRGSLTPAEEPLAVFEADILADTGWVEMKFSYHRISCREEF